MKQEPLVINKAKIVIQSCYWVHNQSKHVKINSQKIANILPKLSFTPLNNFFEDLPSQPQKILEFLFVLDALNFCFWPLEGFQFLNLAKGIRNYLKKNQNLSSLKNINEETIIKEMFLGDQICLVQQRTKIIRNLAQVVDQNFQGSFINLVKSADKSAIKLLQILTSKFIFFQDHNIYEGHQIHFYKRAQLLIRHIYGIFQGKNFGEFHDIAEITIFPDYRIPQVLHSFQIFEYSPQLNEKVLNKVEIPSNSNEQIEIRANTVIAAEKIKETLAKQGKIITSVQLDWALWFYGESNLNSLKPHHRTLTIYY